MMKASDIRPGDVLVDKGRRVYTVGEVRFFNRAARGERWATWVTASVMYTDDGGEDFRSWLATDEVPLTRPEEA